MLTKEEVLEALKEGRVSYSVRYNGRWTGPIQIPPEDEVVRVADQKQSPRPNQEHTRV